MKTQGHGVLNHKIQSTCLCVSLFNSTYNQAPVNNNRMQSANTI